MSETRQEQYLRILTSEPQKTLSDASVVKWLIDNGYAKGAVTTGRKSNPTDEDTQIIWGGITEDGRIFVEELQAELAEVDKSQNIADNQDSHQNSGAEQLLPTPIKKINYRVIVETIFAGLMVMLIWHFISPYLRIFN